MKNRNKKKAGETSYANRLQEVTRRFDEFSNNIQPCMSHGYKSQEKRAEMSNRLQRARKQSHNKLSSILLQFVLESLSETGLDTLSKTGIVDFRQSSVPRHPQLSNETYGTIPNRQQYISAEYLRAVKWLHEIFVMRQSESAGYEGDLPTSFVCVETEIARCISECLADVPARMRSVSYIRSLVRCNRVVQLLPDGRHSVSLRKVHVILQDNFEGSCFCKLLNILLAGFMGSETKTIDF